MAEQLSPEAFDEAVRARFEADKNAEWERMEDEDWETAHGLYNATTEYVKWRRAHQCADYPDYTGTRCAVCGQPIQG